MSSQQLAGGAVRDELADTGAIFHGPAVGDIAEFLYLDGDVEAFLARLFFRQTYRGDLRVGKDGRWDIVVGQWAEVF